MMLRRTQRTYDPPPSEVLSPAELARAEAWRGRYGELTLTREPDAGRVLRRFEPVRIPLVEIVGQHGCSGLCFLRWLRDHQGVTS